MNILKIKYRELEERLLAVEGINAELAAENARLRGVLQAAEIKIGELEEKLGLNSQNSSIPSSKELYKIKRHKIKSSVRKIGAQPGHKGVFRANQAADEIVVVPVDQKCECGGSLWISNKPYIRQIVDIPEIRPYVTEYRMAHGRCRSCGKRKAATPPVSPDVFGPRAKTLIASLTAFYKNSKREVVKILKDVCGLDISVGSISNSERRVSRSCESAYYEAEAITNSSDVVHIDETSHYKKGELGWCWMFSSDVGSFIKLTSSRGKKVLEGSVFGPSDSIVVSDRYAVYNYFDDDRRQLCWAHLARDFTRFAHSRNRMVKMYGLELEQSCWGLFSVRKALGNEQITVPTFLRLANKLRQRVWYYLHEISRTPDAVHAVRVANRMIKAEQMMWKFLEAPLNIPLTNNHAERQIRHYVVYRKNSYFTQSDKGDRFLERLISVYLTCKQQGLNPFQNLLRIVSPMPLP